MRRRSLLAGAAASLAAPGLTTPALAQPAKILRVIPQANLTSLDPVWTTAVVTRNHAYLVYDQARRHGRRLRPPPRHGRRLGPPAPTACSGPSPSARASASTTTSPSAPSTAPPASAAGWPATASARPSLPLSSRSTPSTTAASPSASPSPSPSSSPHSQSPAHTPASSSPSASPAPTPSSRSPTPPAPAPTASSATNGTRQQRRLGPLRRLQTRTRPALRHRRPPHAGPRPHRMDRHLGQRHRSVRHGQRRAGLLGIPPPRPPATPQVQQERRRWPAPQRGHLHRHAPQPPPSPVRRPGHRRAVLLGIDQRDYMRAVAGDDTSLWAACESVYTCGTTYGTDAGNAPLRTRSIAAGPPPP